MHMLYLDKKVAFVKKLKIKITEKLEHAEQK